MKSLTDLYKDLRKDIRKYLVFLLAIFAAVTITMLNMTQVVLVYTMNDTGTLKYFYDADVPTDSFVEENMIQKRLLRSRDGLSQAVYLNVPVTRLNQMKLSFRGIEQMLIHNFYVDIPGPGNVDLLPLLTTESFGSYGCTIEGTEPLQISFRSNVNQLTGKELNLFSVVFGRCMAVSFLISLIIWAALSLVTLIFDAYFDKRSIMLFRTYLVLCLLLLVGYTVQNIHQRTTEESSIIPTDEYPDDTALGNYRMYFTASGESIYSLIIDSVKYKKNSGELQYTLKDLTSGEILAEGSGNARDYIWCGSMEYDVSELRFIQNHDYVLEFYLENWENYTFRQYERGVTYVSVVYPYTYQNSAVLILGLLCLVMAGMTLIFRFLKGENANVVWSLLIGIMMVFLIPPFGGSDEIRHTLRAYCITEGNANIEPGSTEYVGSGGGSAFDAAHVPEQLYNLRLIDDGQDYNDQSYQAERSNKVNWGRLINVLENTGNRNSEQQISLWGVMNISAICYIPQIVFIFIWNLFGLPAAGILYAARMGNFLMSWLLLTLCIKLVPERYKSMVFAVGMIPGLVVLYSTCSLDGLVTMLVFLFICYVLRLYDKKVNIGWKESLILAVILFFIAVIKIPYVLVCFSVFLLRKENFVTTYEHVAAMNKKKYFVVIELIVGIGLIALLALAGGRLFLRGGSSILSGEHVNYIIQYPVRILKLAWNFLIIETIPYILQGMSVDKNGLFAVIAGANLLLCACETGKRKDSVKTRIVCWGIALFMIMALFLVGFTMHVPTIGKITQIAGRYFMPAVPFIILGGISSRRIAFKEYSPVPDLTKAVSAGCILFTYCTYWI